MSRTTARLALLCALVGLGASARPPTSTTACSPTRPTRASATSARPCSCTQVYRSRFGTFQGVSVVGLRRHLVRLCHPAVDRRADARARRFARACPGISSPARRSALAVILYLGYASFFLLEAGLRPVPHHLCRRDRALPRFRCGHLNAHAVSSTPRRPGSEGAVGQPARDRRSPSSGSAAPRRRSRSSRAKRAVHGRRPARRPAATQDQRSELERFMASAPRVPLVDSQRRRQGAHRQVQRLSVPGLRPVVSRLQADSGEVRRVESRRGEGRHQGLPAERRTATRR